MNAYVIKGICLSFFVIGLVGSYAYAEQPESLESRIARLERVMNSQKQLDLLLRVKQIKQENQQLRALIEEQSNEIRLLKQKQKDLYTDLNRRLGQAEAGKSEANNTAVVKSSATISATQNTVEVIEKSVSANSTRQQETESINDNVTSSDTVIKSETKTDFQAEKGVYQKAYNELIARQYNKARNSFVQFIKQYPHGRYAHIAQYWIAESSYAQHNYKQAITDYQQLIDNYAVSPKKAEAELKKAYCYYELSEKDKAREVLNNLLKTYPNTTEAGQAKHLLKTL